MFYILKKEKKRNKSIITMNGKYKMFSRFTNNPDNKWSQIDEKKNVIISSVFDAVANGFLNSYYLQTSYRFAYLSLGDDNTPPTSSDSSLGNEVYRVPLVVTNNPSNGVVTADFYITDSEFSGDIEELGMHNGSLASSTADSGNLMSHVLWSHTKSSSEELLIEYELTVT